MHAAIKQRLHQILPAAMLRQVNREAQPGQLVPGQCQQPVF